MSRETPPNNPQARRAFPQPDRRFPKVFNRKANRQRAPAGEPMDHSVAEHQPGVC